MRSHRALAATLTAATLLAALAVLAAPPARAEVTTRVYVDLQATVVNGNYVFVGPNSARPNTIVLTAIPAILTVHLIAGAGTPHTFTIGSTEVADPIVDVDLDSEGAEETVTFTVWAADRIQIGSRNETVDTTDQGIRFVCTPHVALNMIGYITVGGVTPTPAEPEEKGVFLRAYWIGVLGMLGTLLLVGISYFVIKSSSTHFRDHHEHIRRGLP